MKSLEGEIMNNRLKVTAFIFIAAITLGACCICSTSGCAQKNSAQVSTGKVLENSIDDSDFGKL